MGGCGVALNNAVAVVVDRERVGGGKSSWEHVVHRATGKDKELFAGMRRISCCGAVVAVAVYGCELWWGHEGVSPSKDLKC